MKKMIHKELSHRIIGMAMKVHSTLGSGFQEVIYQRALALEMRRNHLDFARELEMSVVYENEVIGERRVDFFVDGKMMVELKAVSEMNDIHLCQCRNYLEAYNLPVGLLINFGSGKLQYKRVYNSKHPEATET